MKKFEVKELFNRESAQKIGRSIRSGVKRVVPQKDDSPEKWFFKVLSFSFIGLMVIVGIVAITGFLLTLKEPEDVVVPSVTGLELSDAIDAIQRVGLDYYVRQEFYSNPDTRGLIMKQEPNSGAIIKAGRRVELYFSKGAALNKVGDYRGRNIEDVRGDLKAAFGIDNPMVSIGAVTQVFDASEAGTILSQEPIVGSDLSRPIRLSLLVSKGLDEALPVVPNLNNLPYREVMDTLATMELPFEWRLVETNSDHQAGSVFEQNPPAGANLPLGERVILTMMAPSTSGTDMLFGIYEKELPDYVVPVEMVVRIYEAQGETRILYRFKHPGGKLSFPYYVKDGTEISIIAFEKVLDRRIIGAKGAN